MENYYFGTLFRVSEVERKKQICRAHFMFTRNIDSKYICLTFEKYIWKCTRRTSVNEWASSNVTFYLLLAAIHLCISISYIYSWKIIHFSTKLMGFTASMNNGQHIVTESNVELLELFDHIFVLNLVLNLFFGSWASTHIHLKMGQNELFTFSRIIELHE